MNRSRISLGHFSYSGGSLLSACERLVPFLGAILIAFVLAWAAASSLEWFFAFNSYKTGNMNVKDKEHMDVRLSPSGVNGASISDFVNSNPFDVRKRQLRQAGVAPVQNKDEIFSLEGMTLSGTIPGIGAQIRDGDQEFFVLKDNEYKGYVLREIESNRAFFVKDEEEFILHLLYGHGEKGRKDPTGNTSRIRKTAPVNNNGQRINAAGVGENGTIARELVNDLLMNPFNEMKKVRLRAKFQDGNPLGIEVQWLAKDSLLRELGVEKGDIVQSINSVPINNMGDISNAINSLIGGDRFEVEVLRKGENVPLTYMVK